MRVVQDLYGWTVQRRVCLFWWTHVKTHPNCDSAVRSLVES